MSDEIKIWLSEEGSYADGLDILERTTKVETHCLARLKSKRENREMLTFLLKQCVKKGFETKPKEIPASAGMSAGRAGVTGKEILLAEDEIIIRKPDKKTISLKSDLEKKKVAHSHIEQLKREKGKFYKEYLDLHFRLGYAEEGEELAKIHNRIVEIWDKEINPRWKIIDEYEKKGIEPEKLKGLTIGKLFSELKNIPTKISRIHRLMKATKDIKRNDNYKLQLQVHEKEMSEHEDILKKIENVNVDLVMQIV